MERKRRTFQAFVVEVIAGGEGEFKTGCCDAMETNLRKKCAEDKDIDLALVSA